LGLSGDQSLSICNPLSGLAPSMSHIRCQLCSVVQIIMYMLMFQQRCPQNGHRMVA
jgi:hypothetical protein